MGVEELLTRLGAVRRSRTGWIARCPAHEDRSPSLSVREGEEGRILLHCFAQCSVESICAALRIRVSDLFVESNEPCNVVPAIVRGANRIVSDGFRYLPRSMRAEPMTVIFTDGANADAAIARGLALTVEGELVQVALKGSEG